MSHSKRFQFSGFERSRDRYDLPNRDTIRKCTTRLLVVGVSLLMTGVLPVEALQDRFRIVNQAQAQVRAQVVQRLVETRQEVELDELNSGAVLKTDPDLEGTLEKAERFRVDGNFRVACQLWQAVLNQSGDALYSEDGVTYLSLVDQVETILANLPPEGLAAYRVLADASAKEILASAETDSDESALNQVVRQYFVSTLGDQAAFDLGCIYLDRFDFSGARRMFEKIIRKYPDPKIPVEKIYVRIALCHSFLGNVDSAKQSLDDASEVNPTAENLELVSRSVGKLKSSKREAIDASWTMAMGNAQRYGITKGVDSRMLSGDLESVWQFYFAPEKKYLRSADIVGHTLAGTAAHSASVEDTKTEVERGLIDAWREKSWRPVGELLINDGKAFFKTGADLSVWDVETAKGLPESNADDQKSSPTAKPALSWRSVWANAFMVDEATEMYRAFRKSYGVLNRRGGLSRNEVDSPQPNSDVEIQLFGDAIYHQMSILDGVVYSIEGSRFKLSRRTSGQASNVRAQWNTGYRRTRVNFLTAYDSQTGKVLWQLPRKPEEKEGEGNQIFNQDEEDPPWIINGGFMAAPISFGGLLIVPVNVGGAISVYALDPKDQGKTVWKSFLCDEPDTGAVAWSPINLSIDGSDLFINCGLGVIFILDPATGLVRFAKRYPRDGELDDLHRRMNWTVSRLNFSGWSSDVVIPYGRQMICFSSDSNQIFSFDRNTGEEIWKNKMQTHGFTVDYILGVFGSKLYVAGPETIVAYDLDGEGRMVWGAEQAFEGKQSFGRGLLTPEGIYMPVEDEIYHFNLDGDRGLPKILGKVHVELGTKAPVGNLYSDGESFWVHGANRLYLLAPVD